MWKELASSSPLIFLVLLLIGGWRALLHPRVGVPIGAGIVAMLGSWFLVSRIGESTVEGLSVVLLGAAGMASFVWGAIRGSKRHTAIDDLMTRIHYQQSYIRNGETPPPGNTPTLQEDLEALLPLISSRFGAPGHGQVTTAWVRQQLEQERLRLRS